MFLKMLLSFKGGENMKKLISGVALAAVLVSGSFFALNAEKTDLAGIEHEPTILSVGSPTVSF